MTSLLPISDPEIARDILESLPIGLCVIDMERKVVLWSDGAERITGRLRHEVIGRSCIGETLLHCDQPGCEFCGEECPLGRAMKTGQPAEGVTFLHHKAGYEFPLFVRAVPVRNCHGSIIGAIETFDEQHMASSVRQENSEKARGWVDEVTGLGNRTMMQTYLREALNAFGELSEPFSVLLLRVEGLEQFRTRVGPDAASSFLRVVARTLENAVWKTDLAGRWSDDHFLIILHGCGGESLYAVRERIRRMLSNDSIEWWGERRSLAVSVGHATAQPGDNLGDLLERAQRSLDSAWPGRNRATSASESSGS